MLGIYYPFCVKEFPDFFLSLSPSKTCSHQASPATVFLNSIRIPPPLRFRVPFSSEVTRFQLPLSSGGPDRPTFPGSKAPFLRKFDARYTDLSPVLLRSNHDGSNVLRSLRPFTQNFGCKTKDDPVSSSSAQFCEDHLLLPFPPCFFSNPASISPLASSICSLPRDFLVGI